MKESEQKPGHAEKKNLDTIELRSVEFQKLRKGGGRIRGVVETTEEKKTVWKRNGRVEWKTLEKSRSLFKCGRQCCVTDEFEEQVLRVIGKSRNKWEGKEKEWGTKREGRI